MVLLRLVGVHIPGKKAVRPYLVREQQLGLREKRQGNGRQGHQSEALQRLILKRGDRCIWSSAKRLTIAASLKVSNEPTDNACRIQI